MKKYFEVAPIGDGNLGTLPRYVQQLGDRLYIIGNELKEYFSFPVCEQFKFGSPEYSLTELSEEEAGDIFTARITDENLGNFWSIEEIFTPQFFKTPQTCRGCDNPFTGWMWDNGQDKLCKFCAGDTRFNIINVIRRRPKYAR